MHVRNRGARATGVASILLVGSLAVVVRGAAGQESACLGDFEALVAKVQENYAGYAIEVDGRRDAQYSAMVTRVRGMVQRADSIEACIYALREYTGWFRDPHLFIGQFPEYDEARLAAFAAEAEAERLALSREEAVSRLTADAGVRALDPVEGIWYDETTEIAVVPDSASGQGSFVGIVVRSSTDAWRPGDVKARISRVEDRAYRVVLRLSDRSPRYIEGSLYKDDLLFRLAPYAWGRRFPVLPRQEGLLDAADPRAPLFTARPPDAVVLSIPSHDPKYRPALERLVRTHASDIGRAAVLIVDLRGNEGGSSGTTKVLEPYYVSADRPERRNGAEQTQAESGPPVVLASPANLRAFERWKQWYDPTPKWLTDLLTDLEERTGELVPFPSSSDDSGTAPPSAAESPRRFAVLIDRGVVSAGEAFVLEVGRFERVTTYGQPTGGSIDYQNVQMLALAGDDRGLVVGYPTLATSTKLPEGGHNATGIAPDVAIGPEVEDPIAFIIQAE